MRDINFRGKRIDNNEWVYGYYLKNQEGISFIVSGIWCDKYGNPSTSKPSIKIFEIHPETVGQYTGLKDNNGKEIYEGDIIEFGSDFGGEVFKKPIIFEDGCFLASESGVLCHINYPEIIGHIHGETNNESY